MRDLDATSAPPPLPLPRRAPWRRPVSDPPPRLYLGNKSVEDILLKEELDAWSRHANGRLKLVHVVGSRPDEPAPPGDAANNGARTTV